MSRANDNQITVAIVEDDAQVRHSLEGIVKRGQGVLCVGAFANAEEALRELPRLQPRVALMDINLPGMDGVECVRKLSGLLPEMQMVMLTMYDNTDAIFNSLAAGASGYLLKPVSAAQLLAALNAVYACGARVQSKFVTICGQTFTRTYDTARRPVILPKSVQGL